MSSYQYHGTRDLIALPGRLVQTFPSGLVRVERSFMCRKADVAKYRNALRVNEPMPFDDGAPAIDGLYIFPEVQEQVRDDGFVEFRVTAYGRTNAEPILTRGTTRGTVTVEIALFNEDGELLGYNYQSVPSVNDVLDFKAVLPSSTSPTLFSVAPQGYGATAVPLPNIPILGRILPPIVYLGQVSSVNFGVWSEWSYSYEAR